MIKAVIFDVDGVLLDSFAANLKFYQNLMAHVGYPVPTREVYKNMFHLSMMDVIRLLTKSKSEKRIEEIWQTARDARETLYPKNLISVPEGLEQTIKTLSKKYLLGIVTNRIKGGIFMLPQLAPIENCFKTVIYYEDTTKHKPLPDPLLLASERLAIKTDEAVYVGDSESDIEAARAAKMKAIAYSDKKFAGADATTSVFIQLPDLVKSLS